MNDNNMFDTIEQIYNFMGQCIYDNLPIDEWHLVTLNLEVDTGYVSYGGKITDTENETKTFSVRNFPDDFDDAIHRLHKITTEGDHNRWNKAKFTMDANHKFEMEFIWDQEQQDEVDKLNEELA